jgi:hypothetical protein
VCNIAGAARTSNARPYGVVWRCGNKMFLGVQVVVQTHKKARARRRVPKNNQELIVLIMQDC